LLGGRNRDTLSDGDTSGAADSDVLDGRGDEAIVSYATRTAPIFVDLRDPSSAGEAGERDELRSVSGITGGRGDDNLRGDNRPNVLDGGAGADRLRGGLGDDFIDGDSGTDQLSGQAGDDFLSGGPGRDTAGGGPGRDIVGGGAGRDHVRGGSGADHLASGAASCGRGADEVKPSAGDYVARDCEILGFALHIRRDEIADEKGIRVDPYPVRQDAASVTLRVQCPYTEIDGYPSPLTIRGSVRITGANGRLFGYAAVPLAGRRCATATEVESASELPWVRIRVPLTPAGRTALTARRTSLARVAFAGRNVPPVPWRVAWRL
jgi:hypothetical protein